MIPEHPNVRLTRRKTADALTEAGFPVKEATLATKARVAEGRPTKGLDRARFTVGATRCCGRRGA